MQQCMLRPTIAWLSWLALNIGCGGPPSPPPPDGALGPASGDAAGDPPTDCGLTVTEPPPGVPVDPCAGGFGVVTLFGPETFERESGAPQTVERVFAVAAGATFCVRAVNGDGVEGDRIASASVSIDGDEVLGASSFDANVPVAEARPVLAPGAHTLRVDLASGPGSRVTVEIRASSDPTVPRPAGEGTHVAAINLFDDPDPFTPNGDGADEFVTLGVDAQTLKTPGSASGNFTWGLQFAFDLVSAETCEAIRSLRGEVAAAGGTQPIRTTWDGAAETGDPAPAGEYLYVVRLDLVKTNLHSGVAVVQDAVTTSAQRLALARRAPRIIILEPEYSQRGPSCARPRRVPR